jgi:hypothetical protein
MYPPAILQIKRRKPGDGLSVDSAVDRACRRMSHYFRKVVHLLLSGLTDERVASIALRSERSRA